MLRSYENNYTLLNKLYNQEQNDLMLSRLKNAKSIVNTNCPNSFNIFRKKSNKSQEKKKDLSNKKLFNNTFF
jgi:hypothetical protein